METSEASSSQPASTAAAPRSLPALVHPQYLKMDAELPYMSVEEVQKMDKTFDLIIVGCGPAGRHKARHRERLEALLRPQASM